MRTIREGHALLLRGMGWTECVAGSPDILQTSGWLPPGAPAPEQTINLQPGARLPAGCWSTVRAMQRVMMEAFSRGELLLEVLPLEEAVRMRAENQSQDFVAVKDVPWDTQPEQVRVLWSQWVEEVMAVAPGPRRTPEEAAKLVADWLETMESSMEVEIAGAHDHGHEHDHYHDEAVPEVPEVWEPADQEQVPGPGWQTVATLRGEPAPPDEPVEQPLVGVAATAMDMARALASAQQILDEGGKGAKTRALEVLGLRHG